MQKAPPIPIRWPTIRTLLRLSWPPPMAAAPSGRVIPEAGVNVRTGPGTGYDIWGVAAEGVEGEIIGVSQDGAWWVASVPEAPNGQGWVAAAHIEATDADDVPVIDAPPMAAVVQMPAMEVVDAPDELDPESVIVFSASRVLREGNRAYDLEDIYAVSAQPGSEATLIIANAMQPSVLRGGNIMAFRSVQADQLGLSAYDFDADERVRYSANLEDSTPRWSPTGDRLVFSSNRTGDRRWHVYIVEPIPSNDRTGFPEVIDLGFGKDADWHPTGDVIVFKGCDAIGQQLWSVDHQQRRFRAQPADRRLQRLAAALVARWRIYRLHERLAGRNLGALHAGRG